MEVKKIVEQLQVFKEEKIDETLLQKKIEAKNEIIKYSIFEKQKISTMLIIIKIDYGIYNST